MDIKFTEQKFIPNKDIFKPGHLKLVTSDSVYKIHFKNNEIFIHKNAMLIAHFDHLLLSRVLRNEDPEQPSVLVLTKAIFRALNDHMLMALNDHLHSYLNAKYLLLDDDGCVTHRAPRGSFKALTRSGEIITY